MKTNIVDPGKDIQAIRDIMERSSKFLSLSGLSGIIAGILAIIGATIAWFIILNSEYLSLESLTRNSELIMKSGTGLMLLLDAVLVLLFAMAGAFYFSQRKARKAGQKFWTKSSKRLLFHLFLPLVAGGILIIILILRNKFDLIIPLMLVFYGLALVNAGKFTFGEIHYLGLTEIVLGILAAVFINYGLLLWTIGFGLMHIIYGLVMYYRHERVS